MHAGACVSACVDVHCPDNESGCYVYEVCRYVPCNLHLTQVKIHVGLQLLQTTIVIYIVRGYVGSSVTVTADPYRAVLSECMVTIS